MNMKLNKASLLLFLLLYSFTAHTQDNTIDSIQKVLKTIQKNLGNKKYIPGLENGIPGLHTYVPGMEDSIKNFTQHRLNEVFENLHKGLSAARAAGDINKLQGSYYELTKLDSTTGNYKQAYEHYKLYTLYRDSLQKKEIEKKELQAKMQYEFDKKQAIAKAEQAKKDAEQRRIKNIQYFTIAGLAFLLLAILLFASIQWRNNKQKKKANFLLQQQNAKVEETLTELKSAQSQLIQAEKMASLGELTAGIAHEIQNPLNFVNNFSEVNTELIEELTNELNTGNKDEAISIAKDIKENEVKINHHGKRADAIVKGMLQHSRVNRGQKELTDINALADEYLRLSYHGIRARDKNFNADFKTDFDQAIGKINIVPQDIGRVLLNLYNNAFYAVNEKKPLTPKGEKNTVQIDYKPTVTVTTKSVKSTSGVSEVILTVKDNGNGIPQKVLDKIFQPFFTTKPTGEGTGLGLSLSYDIVKAHGGDIRVETQEGQGTEFIITLPINK